MVDTMLHEHGSFERSQDGNLRSRSRLIKCAKDTGHYRVRLRGAYPNHVWSYDFVEDRTHDGRKYRMLNVVYDFTHEALETRICSKQSIRRRAV